MELFIFARFHARAGSEEALERTLQAVIKPTRGEEGCLGIQLFRSTRDSRLFYIHSRWVDEAAFDLHATLPHTTEYIPRAETLIDHALDVTRTRVIG
jgi:quinol monooxygenase YgiN